MFYCIWHQSGKEAGPMAENRWLGMVLDQKKRGAFSDAPRGRELGVVREAITQLLMRQRD